MMSPRVVMGLAMPPPPAAGVARSEEHTSELQSQPNLVCRLLLEKKTDIVVGMSVPGVSVAAVGDDAPAIYGVRSSSAGHMIEFPEQFPGTTDVTVHRHYRCTPEV